MKETIFVLAFLFNKINGDCSIEPPLKVQGDEGASYGMIFVPGAKIAGSAYLPLLRRIQEDFPGSLWIGATTEWLGDMPNPIEIGGQISECLLNAKAQGLDTSRMFFGGHSLGGIVLENYISGHPELAQGIVLLGTWLPDLLRADNEFPVPVLTAIGELDGGGISYLRREWEETQALSEEKKVLTKTILVPQVNHGQVASGEMPESVVDNDIDAELSEEDAHRNYATRVSDWLVLHAMSSNHHERAVRNFAEYERETEEFLAPFTFMRNQEQYGTDYAPFAADSQEYIMDPVLPDNLDITNHIIDVVSFEVKQPSIVDDQENGVVKIETLTYLTYDFDALDFNNHLSASTMKVKLKSADSIYKILDLPQTGKFTSCADLNRRSMELARSAASRKAIARMEERGRSLKFDEDLEMGWGGIPWENGGGLTWKEETPGIVNLKSSRLTSGVDFPFYPGLHYCDILSPYRALEWIYIESLRHVLHF